ncbi:hypothetical protein LTR17_027507 [Elasticomyces elasticus]|nr:hypothetical protein LTR17_027507 [Elasticomyces elasticus]
MPFTKIVVAGSTGALADHVLRAVLSSTEPKFEVTVLTRKGSDKVPSLPGAKLVPVDYSDHQALVQAVSGHDAIVSLVGGMAANPVDSALLKAAQAAEVRRIFTSEYTVDILHPAMVSLYSGEGWPEHWDTHLKKARRFAALADAGSSTSYTTLMPSAFVDNWLAGVYGNFDPKGRKVTLIDGGDFPFTGCSLEFLAACIVAALQMPEEETKNKRIPVSEVRTTMKEIVRVFEKVTGDSFTVDNVTSKSLLDARAGAFKDEVFPMAAMYTHVVGAFNGQGAGDLQEGLKFDGDGFLTMKRKTIEELAVAALDN